MIGSRTTAVYCHDRILCIQLLPFTTAPVGIDPPLIVAFICDPDSSFSSHDTTTRVS